jgi:hypothetical protein
MWILFLISRGKCLLGEFVRDLGARERVTANQAQVLRIHGDHAGGLLVLGAFEGR